MNDFIFPDDVGIPIGTGVGDVDFVIVEMHYDNPSQDNTIVDDFQLDHLPSHLLIDPDGNISQFPALPPSPLSKGYNSTTIDKTFFTIKKNTTVKESFKIRKKN